MATMIEHPISKQSLPQEALTPHDALRLKADFPVLQQLSNGSPLVYLDNAATTQKPNAVIDRMTDFYRNEYATVRRGVYDLSARATQAYEAVRKQIAEFIHAASVHEIVFTRGTTESINLVAHTYGTAFIGQGDEILISGLEHHANIVPWQLLCQRTGATLKVAPITDAGEIDLDAFDALLSDKTKLVAVNHVSNALGTVNPVETMIQKAHAVGALALIDGAQSIPHFQVDVQALDCDFYVFSGHKLYGPSGIGVLYAKYGILEKMPPFLGGGDMIETVTFEKTTFQKPPFRFEAGTPAIVEAIGLGEAIAYIQAIGLPVIAAYEDQLLKEATQKLQVIDGFRIIGQAQRKASVISFVLEGVHPHDVGTILDQQGIAVRAGHHCAQPIMTRFGIPATTRASFSFYNTPNEIDRLVEGIQHVITIFR